MTKYEIVSHLLKKSRLAKNHKAVTVYGGLLTAITRFADEIYKDGKHDLTDPEFVSVIRKEIKLRKDAAEQFEKGNRLDLVKKEEDEIAELITLLPKEIDEAELEKIIVEAIQTTGATTKKQMGQVIKLVKEKTGGAVDGKKISEKVSAALI